MPRRPLLFLALAFIGGIGSIAAGCRSSDPPDNPMPDAPGADAAPDVPVGGPPETQITAGPVGDVITGARLEYKFTSPAAGATFECRVDTAAFAACTSPHAITALAGPHTLEVRALAGGEVDPTPATRGYNGLDASLRLRIMAGNLTSGNGQAYEAPGMRLFQGLEPDIALVQEMNIGDNSEAALRAWVDTTFGAAFSVFRETGAQIPNGIVSRYPIIASGVWEDTQSPNREFVYARIDVPGPADLWAISVHLLTDGGKRPAEATQLVGYINAQIPAGDYLVIGGDFNTGSRTETAVQTLGQVVQVGAPFPVDQAGDGDTNANRNSPYDWVMFDGDLAARQVPVAIGAATFPAGLVFDSRVYTPLADVSPILASDSGAPMMQHMGVIKDVLLAGP